ncbi:Asp23/Gls24 family envelope stress response protein [Arthrobacter agilis]|uniref:Asp23/Gls24 family envelope stress response protein n=1 Tax=Arthrobacter agilis TaxID=37921 RepID=UPI000B34BD62|nr:Asp23/Gls24 family envelope stress response protein [Arthrobacter agilis]OUM43605.1 Asp23/Gls24 family envelope stress response protein [Arthrobacter agilis]PPB46808.1 Asp23/Gls24 family envelope stress response protein [Arthrobacter agilis]TPV24850.1 Asp23/Gls24 family envelope stress response protein [Arthrobacter agilis]VDR31002.1 Stress response regulator gls24 homolog [Arthrobacter agilis]
MIEQPMGRPAPALQDAPAGRTVIGDPAAVKIAAIAARSVPGVHALGPGAGRALGAIRDAVGANDLAHGVKVEVGQTQLAVDISLVADYGFPLNALADAVRAAVYEALTDLVGLEVIEVNIEVLDVHIQPAAESKAADKPRPTGASSLKQPVE